MSSRISENGAPTQPAAPRRSSAAAQAVAERPGGTRSYGDDSRTYIEQEIRRTRRTVKLVDIATALMQAAIGVLGILLVLAFMEHWLIPGGLSDIWRMLAFAVLACCCGVFLWKRVWPLVWQSINPAYAALEIERNHPSLKNSLLNLLLFRQRKAPMPETVYEALERQAADRLSHVPPDSAVDRSHLIHVGYVFLAVAAACALYTVFSPKDPIITARRVLMPWADIAPASRVTLDNVQPGSTTLTRGEMLTVSADVRGLKDEEEVLLRYSTSDGRAAAQAVPMHSNFGLQFEGRLPGPTPSAAPPGIQDSLIYWIEAGDARSRRFEIDVIAAPTISVARVDYDYPDYTGLVDRTIEGLGDLQAIEGTQVTVHALANVEIGEAQVDFEADGRRDLDMQIDGTRAAATFTLALRDDRRTPRHTKYVLRLTTPDGHRNQEPVAHKIDVLRDYSPEVELLAPVEPTLDVRLDETVTIEVDARDPDYALGELRLHGELTGSGRAALDEVLLDSEHRGRFVGRYRLTPSELGLQAGDQLAYWATAADNRTPEPNLATTRRKMIRVISPEPNQPPDDQLARGDPQGGDPNADAQQQPGENQPGAPGAGAEGQAGQQQGQPGAGGQPQVGNQPQEGQQSENGAQQESQPGETGGQGQDADGGSAAGRGGQAADQTSGAESRREPGETPQDPTDQDGNASATPDGQAGRSGAGRNRPAGRSGGAGQDPAAEPEPVSAEGDNDGEAFERMQRFFEEQQQDGSQQEGDQSSDQQGDPSQDGQQQGGQQQPQSGQGQSAEQQSTEQQTGAQQQPGDPQGEQQQGEEQQPGDDTTQQPSPSRDPSANPQSRPGDPASEAPSATPDSPLGSDRQPGQPRDPASAGNPNRGQNQPESPAEGQPTQTEGPAGGGDQPENDTGSRGPIPDRRNGERIQQNPTDPNRTPDGTPPSSGTGQRRDDTFGEQGSDNVQPGEQRGPETQEHEGTGSAGQNQSADEGAGESAERGAGRTAPDAGQARRADEPTGQPGEDTPGRGSTSREGQGDQTGPSGERPAGENQPGGGAQQRDGAQQSASNQAAGEESGSDTDSQSPDRPAGRDPSQNGQAGDPSANRQPTSNQQQSEQQPPGTNQPQGDPSNPDEGQGGPSNQGGGIGRGQSQPAPLVAQGDAPPEDSARLEYTRRQTDLILEKLSDQLNDREVDRELLDNLGWSEDDLRQFVDRWQQRRQSAEGSGPQADEARRDLDAALRSLGLGRQNLRSQTERQQDDLRSLQQEQRSPVPLDFLDRLRRYNQSISQPSGSE